MTDIPPNDPTNNSIADGLLDNPHYTRDLDTPQDLDALARETRWSWRWPG